MAELSKLQIQAIRLPKYVALTDIHGSMQLRREIGDIAFGNYFSQHLQKIDEIASACNGEVCQDTGDGAYTLLPTLLDAFKFAITTIHDPGVDIFARRIRAIIGIGEVTRYQNGRIDGLVLGELTRLVVNKPPAIWVSNEIMRRLRDTLGQNQFPQKLAAMGIIDFNKYSVLADGFRLVSWELTIDISDFV